jgi:hypothetical protein
MSTLASLLPDLLGRLEETPSPPGPIFWNQTYELLPELVDAMFEATLLTGVVQAVNIPVVLAPNTTYFSLAMGQGYGFGGFGEGGYGGGTGIPAGAIAALRIKAPWVIRKTSLQAIDDVFPGWENLPPGNQLRGWFPLGVSGFGIYPQLSVESQVVMDFIVSPVNVPRPYPTTLSVPFQEEFFSAFPEYAATMLRTKELGVETEEAETVFNSYMDKMRQLSLFQNRLDSQVMMPTFGANVAVNRRTQV